MKFKLKRLAEHAKSQTVKCIRWPGGSVSICLLLGVGLSLAAFAQGAVPDAPIYPHAFTQDESVNGYSSTTFLVRAMSGSTNEAGFRLDVCRDGGLNNWTTLVRFPAFGLFQAGDSMVPGTHIGTLDYYDQNVTPGTTNWYRWCATNSSGSSAFAYCVGYAPANPGNGVTNWYVDCNAHGNNTGTNWANAWRTLGSINWQLLSGQHTVYISGGTYTNDTLSINKSGTSANAPLTFSTSTEAGHNSRVLVRGGLAIRSHGNYVVVNGASDKSWFPGNDPHVMTAITNNINMEFRGYQTIEAGAAINSPNDTKLLWCEIDNNGGPYASGENWGYGLALNGDLLYTNIEIGFCWVHDNYSHGFNAAEGGSGLGAIKFHHSLLERNHNNFIQTAGGVDVYCNLLRDFIPPDVGHPDGIQGSFNKMRIYNNVWHDCNGQPFYFDITGSVQDLLFYNNVLYFRGHADSVGTYGGMYISTHGNPFGYKSITLSNIVIANNTFWNQDNKFSLSNPVEAQGIHATNILLRAWVFANNLFGGTEGNPDWGSVSFGGIVTGGIFTNNSDADVLFDNNVLCGTQKGITDWKGATYADAAAFDAAHPAFTHNSSAMPLLMDTNSYNFSPATNDTVTVRQGRNLSAFFTTDLVGRPRPSTGAWSIGAYEGAYSGVTPPSRTNALRGPFGLRIVATNGIPVGNTNGAGNTGDGLVLRFSFDTTNWVGTGIVPDVSGHGNDGSRMSLTNFPSVANDGPDGSGAAHFRGITGPNPFDATYTQGDYIAVTNLNSYEYLTNATFSLWAKFAANSYDNSRFMDCLWYIDKTWAFGRIYAEQITFSVYYDSLGDWPALITFPDDRLPGSEATAGWTLYTVTVDCPNNVITGYTNGVPFQTNTINQPYLWVPYDLYYPPVHPWLRWLAIGTMNHYGTPQWDSDGQPNAGWFAGEMDEVRIYNRALSASEVLNTLYLPYKR